MASHRQTHDSQKALLCRAAAGVGLLLFPGASVASQGPEDLISKIKDPVIRAGVKAAVEKNLIPAATQEFYPGYFNISADGGAYGGATWPGLDSWQMAGAYLLLGRTRLVLDYFDFVQASQRKDGTVPFAIFDGATQADGCLSGLRTPEDVFTYAPAASDDAPAAALQPHKWIGLFTHWEPKANPLSTLGTICYLLTASEIYDATHSRLWLREKLPSLQAAASSLLDLKSPNGLISGSGFYTEVPPRYQWDGVTQCYAVHAFRLLASLCRAAGDKAQSDRWNAEAARLTRAFTGAFWREDHFGEYVHPDHGLVDSHGLSDVNWAAVAFGVADTKQTRRLWPKLLSDKAFWTGGMPTETVTKPFDYEDWEFSDPIPSGIPRLNDVAAMGRAWYLEACACRRMGDRGRLVESVKEVCEAAADGYWRERYHPIAGGSVEPAGAGKYCEYPAVLVRVVFGNPDWFTK
jgi:hypothetical protein